MKRKMFGKVVSVCLCLAMVFAFTACSSESGATTEAPGSESQAPATDNTKAEATTAAPAAAGDTIEIGAVLPLTGSSTGEYLKAAMEVAQDIIKNSHDLDWDLAKKEGILGGSKIELVFADHERCV